MTEAAPVGAAEFAQLMTPLGPFGARPHLAVGVSGGPHSLALALLVAEWARRDGRVLALVADHGLRAQSAAEAAGVAELLAARGIAARVLTLSVAPGPGVQARARAARLSALLQACAEAGAPWLLLGQHRGDQAEGVLRRALGGSAASGLAGMGRVRATAQALVLRPLLGMAAARLEATVAAAGLGPLRDPGNRDPRQGRARLRLALAEPTGAGPVTAALDQTAAVLGAARRALGEAVAARLAGCALLHAEGWCTLRPAALGGDDVARAGLAALVRAVGGAAYPPAPAAVAALLARGTGTLGGTWLGPGPVGTWRLVREPLALERPVVAAMGVLWDGRWLLGTAPPMPGAVIGALGPDPAIARSHRLPAAVVAGLPAIRAGGRLLAIPPLGLPDAATAAAWPLRFAPRGGPACG